MHYDVFICHASEDKDDFVRPLAQLLIEQNIAVWYDEFSLTIGDSLSRKIDEGLAHSRFGIVVVSPSLFKKPWAKRELAGLTSREMVEDKAVILPIWHRVTVNDVLNFSPSLADKYALSTKDGVNAVIRALKQKIKPEESPLVVASEALAQTGKYYPPISDEWWLDIIEYKEILKTPDINGNFFWIFPLPHPNNDRGRNRGLNIASAALQSDWSFDSDELNISPLTHPEIVHDFIKKWPGFVSSPFFRAS